MKNDIDICFRLCSLIARFTNCRVGCHVPRRSQAASVTKTGAHRILLKSSDIIEATDTARIKAVFYHSLPKAPGKAILCVIALVLFSLTALTSAYPQSEERDYWPTSGWKVSKPEIQGMDSTKLSIAEEFIQNRLPDAYSLLVVKNGYLVYEKYFRNGSPERVASIASVTKSIMSALIGIALDKGYLSSVD